MAIEKRGEERLLPVLEDMQKAKELAAAYEIPIALVFVGSDWCPFSQKLLSNVMASEEFFFKMKKKALFVKLDFPELCVKTNLRILEQRHELKKFYHIEEFPTVVLLDYDLKEITRIGYDCQKPAEYADKMTECFEKYKAIVKEFKSVAKPRFSFLKRLYLQASQIGSEVLKQEIMQSGLEVDEEAYFHLEKYKKASGQDRTALKEKILKAFGSSDFINLQMALLDYQENIEKGVNDKEALKPLALYAESLGLSQKDESFRVHMLIAQHLANEGDVKEALKHAHLSLQNAPDNHRDEVKRTIKLLQAEIIASKEF